MQIIDHTGKRLTLDEIAALESAPDANQSPDILAAFTTEETTMPLADDINLTHLRIENFRGLELLDIDLPRSGVIFSGTKGIGKTSALESFPAILEGIGISPDAIRLDTTKTRLALNFEKAGRPMVATRTINAAGASKGTTIELKNGDVRLFRDAALMVPYVDAFNAAKCRHDASEVTAAADRAAHQAADKAIVEAPEAPRPRRPRPELVDEQGHETIDVDDVSAIPAPVLP